MPKKGRKKVKSDNVVPLEEKKEEGRKVVPLGRLHKAEVESAYKSVQLAQVQMEQVKKELSDIMNGVFSELNISNRNSIRIAEGIIVPPEGEDFIIEND